MRFQALAFATILGLAVASPTLEKKTNNCYELCVADGGVCRSSVISSVKAKMLISV